MQKMTDEQRMSETKLPKEIIEQIDAVCKTVYEIGYVPFEKNYMQRGATIASAHHEQENKRLVELLKPKIESIWRYNYTLEQRDKLPFSEYWQQYCKDNGIKE